MPATPNPLFPGADTPTLDPGARGRAAIAPVTKANCMSDLLSAVEEQFVTVDGIFRPRLNSEGKPLTDSPEMEALFWGAFKDSALVDSQGRPQVLYHGTAAVFDEFMPSAAAFYGAGIYFCDNWEAAKGFGDDANESNDPTRVIAVYLRMRNPFVFDAPPAEHEPTNITLARALLGDTPEFAKLASWLSRDWNQPAHEFQDRLRSKGHDGLIVRLPGEHTEYVAFDSSQILWADRFHAQPAHIKATRRRMR